MKGKQKEYAAQFRLEEHRRRRHAIVIACLLVLGGACRDGAPPSYVRISGQAPVMADVPSARALLVVFWATWCAPCREETPQLRALASNPPEGLRVVVVSQDTERAAVEEFFAGPPDPSLNLKLDPDKKLFNAFRVETLPATFLVVDGELRARFGGSQPWDGKQVRALLERLIAEERSAIDCPQIDLYA
jgi:thiol-disulfide isomerase/thioredoxin